MLSDAWATKQRERGGDDDRNDHASADVRALVLAHAFGARGDVV